MATELEIRDWSGVTAENDLSAKQFYALELGTAAGEVDACDGATDLVVGILQNKPTAGKAAVVRTHGISKAVAGGSITRGNRVGTHTDGTLVAKTADADLLVGIALSAASSGEIFDVLLTIGCQRAA